MAKGKHLILMLCTAGVLSLLAVGFFSYGWFVNTKSTQGEKTTMQATEMDFELASLDTAGLYDGYLTAEDGTLLNGIKTEGTTIDLTATGGGKNEIKWLMAGGSNFNNYPAEDAPHGIQPGSSGVLSFYVIAKRDTSLDITFSLDTVLYTPDAKPIDEINTNNDACIIAEDSPEAKLVKGHILFFKTYDKNTGLYSNRITDGTFTFSEADAKTGTAYRQDIYWIWPYVSDQLILPKDDKAFMGREYGKIISDDDTSVMITELWTNPDRYFTAADNIAVMLENMSKGTADAAFDRDYYNAINERWNGADHLIGRNVGFVELQISNKES
ncbi:MAG: hypothetical protein ACI4Q6_07320 [Huintestinicola sp.]